MIARTHNATCTVWVEDENRNVVWRGEAQNTGDKAAYSALGAAGFVRWSNWLHDGVHRSCKVTREETLAH